MKIFFIISLFCSFSWAEVAWEDIDKGFYTKSVKVPRELWKLLKAELKEAGVTDSQLKLAHLQKIEVDVELKEKTPGVLGKKNFRLKFKGGGGRVNFADYVSKQRGDFFVSLKPKNSKGEKLDGFGVFFVSYSKERTESGQKWGNGCGKIGKLDEQIAKLEAENLVTASKQHYLSLFAGRFIFYKFEGEKVLLGQVEMTDSRFPHILCDFARFL